MVKSSLGFILALQVVGVSSAAEWQPYFKSEVELHSQPINLKGAFDDWQSGDYQSGDQQFGSIQFKAGVKYNNNKVAALYRQDYEASFSPSTGEYYYQVQQDKLAPNQAFNLDLNAATFKGQGIEVAHQWQLKNALQLELSGQVFGAYGLQKAELTGKVTTGADAKEQLYQANIRYFYDKDRLLDRPNVVTPDGMGYSLGAKLHWQAERFDVDLKVNDLLGAVYWDNVPYTDAVIDSNVKGVDKSGFTVVKARLSGVEGYQASLTQRLKPKVQAEWRYHPRQTRIQPLVAAKYIPDETLLGAGVLISTKRGNFKVTAWPKQKFITAEYQKGKWGVGLGADHVNSGDLRRFWLNLQYND